MSPRVTRPSSLLSMSFVSFVHLHPTPPSFIYSVQSVSDHVCGARPRTRRQAAAGQPCRRLAYASLLVREHDRKFEVATCPFCLFPIHANPTQLCRPKGTGAAIAFLSSMDGGMRRVCLVWFFVMLSVRRSLAVSLASHQRA